MAVERDIAGISVPFAAGVAAGVVLCSLVSCFSHSIIPAATAGVLAGASIITTMRLGCGDSPLRIRGSVAFMFLSAGLLCAFEAYLMKDIPETDGGHIGRIASEAVLRLRRHIDSIPYGSGSTGPLVKALLTGDRTGLDKDIVKVFRDSGASHILALSGLHLGIIYIILCRLAAPLGNSRGSRILKFSLIVGATGFYSVMTGASPSIERAFLFITLNETARLTGRERDPVRILLGALTIQLALRPMVISSIGFQLSYLAMGGIVFIYPRLRDLYPESGFRGLDRINPLRKIWQAAAMSISCQIPTAPAVWLRFHSFPEYFIITNLAALPMTSAIMILSLATIALSAAGLCPPHLVAVNDWAVQKLVWCLQIISGLSVS